MKVCLITIDSVRYDVVPQWFIEKHKLTVCKNARTYYAGTIPSLVSFYTGVPPPVHGIMSHHTFYKYRLRVESIYDLLHGKVPAYFASDEWLMYQIPCLESATKIKMEDVPKIFRMNQPDFFLGIHIFHPTHAPYQSKEVLEKIHEGRRNFMSHWTDREFLEFAKKKYLEKVEETFQIVSQFLEKAQFDHYIVSADHGEAFGEEGLYGHEEMFIEEVLRIPLLIKDGEPKVIEEVVYPSYAFNLIRRWFGV